MMGYEDGRTTSESRMFKNIVKQHLRTMLLSDKMGDYDFDSDRDLFVFAWIRMQKWLHLERAIFTPIFNALLLKEHLLFRMHYCSGPYLTSAYCIHSEQERSFS